MDGNLSSPSAAESRRWPEGLLSPRAGFMPYEPQPISINPVVRVSTPCGQGGIDQGDLRFRPRVVAVVEIWKDF